jgi:glycine cleavage system regulatory protein
MPQLLNELKAALPLIVHGRKSGLQVSIKRKLAHALQTSDDPVAAEVLNHVTILAS